MICVLKHVNVWNCDGINALQYPVSSDGIELNFDSPIGQGPTKSIKRFYRCNNCNREWDGAANFKQVRDHLGKLNEEVMPFTDVTYVEL